MNNNIAAIILAAGKGTRLKKKPENKNKVLWNKTVTNDFLYGRSS
jgi:choline kinase